MLLPLAALLALASAQQLSVLCENNSGRYICGINPYSQSPWTVRVSLNQEQNRTGWANLVAETNGAAVADIAAYGLGYAEGFVSRELIDLSWLGAEQKPSAKAQNFVSTQLAWVQAQATQQKATDKYWEQVC